VIAGLNWHWIFGINVPIGALLIPIAARRLSESRGPNSKLDAPGLALSGLGLLGLVFGLVHAQTAGFGAISTIASLTAGVALLAGFVLVELRTAEPMLPMSFFTHRAFVFTNIASLAMYFGMFGAVFFLSQYLQLVLGNSALQAGLKLLLWTGSVMVVSPIAGVLSAKYGSRPFLVAGLALQAAALAWIALTATTTTSYTTVLVPFVFGGSGMALVFAPSAAAILSVVRADQAGQASGATNAIREVGGVFGVAVLATVFAGAGSYATGHAFVTGLVPALWVGFAVLALATILLAAVPWRSSPNSAVASPAPVPAS
jgi:MFS family permease